MKHFVIVCAILLLATSAYAGGHGGGHHNGGPHWGIAGSAAGAGAIGGSAMANDGFGTRMIGGAGGVGGSFALAGSVNGGAQAYSGTQQSHAYGQAAGSLGPGFSGRGQVQFGSVSTYTETGAKTCSSCGRRGPR